MLGITQHIFVYLGSDDYPFCDALVTPEDDYSLLAEAELGDLKKDRYDAWQTRVHTTDPSAITDAEEAEQPSEDVVVEL